MRAWMAPVAALVWVMGGCVSVDYMGRTYAPTEHVDVFYSLDEVKRPYEVMGQSSARADEGVRLQKVQDELVRDARARGADAIVILDVDRVVSLTETSTSGSVNKNKKKWWEPDYTETSTTTVSHDTTVKARLLKYK